MKKILMITPFFAPYSHAAVYRAHRFAKYLPRFGWKPYVLTIDRSFLYFIDPMLLDDLPIEVEILRSRYIDLSFSGLKSLLEKTITDSKAIKGPTHAELTAKLREEEKKPNLLNNLIDKFRDKVLFFPDRYITWYPFAVKRAKELIRTAHIDIIYSTAYPLTSHLIAMALKERFNIPWVADFREGGIDIEVAGYRSSPFKYKISSILERKVMVKADFILTASRDIKDLFLSKYEGIVNNKVLYIKQSTDVEILQSAELKEKSNKFTIVFTGEFQKEYSRKLFEFLKVIFERNLFERNNIEVLIVGSIKRNIFLKKEIELLSLSDVAKLVDYISWKDYFNFLLSADATLLPGILKYRHPLKITDYLFAKKPIIAFDITDEVRNILQESGLGVIMPNNLDDGIKVLLDVLKGNLKLNINEDYINQFTAFNQTKELSAILEMLVKSS